MHHLTKKIVIASGGTGGHLFPAQALAQDIQKKSPLSHIVFLAGGLASSPYFDRNRFLYHEVSCAPLLSKHPLKCLKGLVRLYQGIRQSLVHLKKFQPDVIVSFGSYYTVPAVVAGRLLGIPIVLHEANSVPGKANRWLASFADCVALHFPCSASFFKTKTIHVGCPLREKFRISLVDKEAALDHYGFTNQKKTLLIFGGSQGAQAINRLISGVIPMLSRSKVQVIHITGKEESKQELTDLYQKHQILASVKVFESEMQYAWKAADFFIGRSGASTIAEAMEFEVPGILIPYPHATENHQYKNSEYFAKTVGGGITLSEFKLTPLQIYHELESFFDDLKLNQMKNRLENYKNRPQQISLYELIMNFEG